MTGLKQSDTSPASGSMVEEPKGRPSRQQQERIEVYPGYSVTSAEYQRRYAGVALDHFRKVLPPDLFKAYVRTMGSVEGWGIKPEERYKGED